jgi:hypothetical protein
MWCAFAEYSALPVPPPLSFKDFAADVTVARKLVEETIWSATFAH